MSDKLTPCPCLEVIQAHLGDVEMDPEVLSAGCFCEQSRQAQVDLPRALAEIAAIASYVGYDPTVDHSVANAVTERVESRTAERDFFKREVEKLRGLLKRVSVRRRLKLGLVRDIEEALRG